MEQGEWKYRLSNKELFFLTHMLGVKLAAAFEDPYRGYMMDELEEEYKRIEPQLIDKGYLIPRKDSKGFDLDEALGLTVAACSANHVVYVHKKISGKEDFEGYLYFTPRIVVEQTKGTGNEIILTPLADAKLSLGVLERIFPLTLKYNSVKSVTIESCTWEAWCLLSSEEQILRLAGAGYDSGTAQDVAEVFSTGERSGTMSFWERSGHAWSRNTCHYAQKSEKLYMAAESEESLIKFQSYQPRLIRRAIQHLSIEMGVTEVEGGTELGGPDKN